MRTFVLQCQGGTTILFTPTLSIDCYNYLHVSDSRDPTLRLAIILEVVQSSPFDLTFFLFLQNFTET